MKVWLKNINKVTGFTGKMKKTKFFAVVGLFFCIIVSTSSLYAIDLSKRCGIGFGSSGFSLKYGLSPHFSLEGRCAFGDGVIATGPRLYYNFNPNSNFVFYVAGDLEYIYFDQKQTENIWGNGGLLFIPVGVEFFINKYLSLNGDFGPAFIYLSESEYNLTSFGTEWVYNLAIYWYF